MPEFTITNTPPTPDSPEYIQAMVNKADGVTPTPELIAGKYKTQEELHKGIIALLEKQHEGNLEAYYKSLETGIGKAQSSLPGAAGPAEGGEVNPESVGTPQQDESKPPIPGNVNDIIVKADLDGDKLTEEFATTGKLSEESYKKLEAIGYPQPMVDQYLAGQVALMQSFNQQVFNVAGGEAQYDKMIQWAKTGIASDEIQAFNELLDSGDMGKIKLAVGSLRTRYEAVFGNRPAEPNLIKGVQSPSLPQGYKSTAEMTADMRDPRYKKDPAFRAEVARKVHLSSF